MVDILKDYDPITLEEMDGIRLMNRTDTKFVTSMDKLYRLLEMAAGEYRAQEIDGKRIAPYYTVYFDTANYDMFLAHQASHANRQKLRIRSYVDSNLTFLEIKTKNNHGRTGKKRISMSSFNPLNPQHDIVFQCQNPEFEVYDEFLRKNLHYEPMLLCEQLENRFNRITLVNRMKTERLTIDTNLKFHNISTRKNCNLTNIAVIELKRDGLVPSPILGMLSQLRIMPLGFSKYCLGSALTNWELKQNRLKPRLHSIERLSACDERMTERLTVNF